MQNLSDKHKAILKEVVERIRSGAIKEEFMVFWGADGAAIAVKDGFLKAPGITRIALDALAEEGLIRCDIHTETNVSEFGGSTKHRTREDYRTCLVAPKGYRAVDSNFATSAPVIPLSPPAEISDSLDQFREDYPDPSKIAFIMMQFSNTQAHQNIVAAIRSATEPLGITALRADDKAYHDDLFPNILTYIHGCSFGIAVFERIEADDFNPNVSLEVGYMLGLRKRVCLLKDKTLKTLQTDLVGKLYRSFDPQDAAGSIPTELAAWIQDRKLMPGTDNG